MSMRCPDPALPFASLAAPTGRNGGTVAWLTARLHKQSLGLSANARAGIRQAVDRLGLAPGDEILVPAWNCGSEVDPLINAGLSIRLYPVGPRGEISTQTLSNWIGETTRAVYIIHYFGWMQQETAEIAQLCQERGLPLIEDCALSLFSDSPQGPAGSFGDAAVFCFYKFFPLIGGGALAMRETYASPEFDRPLPNRFQEKALLREMSRRVLGQGGATAIRSSLKRFTGLGSTKSEADITRAEELPNIPSHYYFDPGFQDARISGITRRLLARTDPEADIRARRHNHAIVKDALVGVPGIVPIFPDLTEGSVPLTFPVLLEASYRNRVCATLQDKGIAATPWWAGYHQKLDWSDTALGPARALKDQTLALPLHPHLSEAQLKWMAQTVHDTIAANTDLKAPISGYAGVA